MRGSTFLLAPTKTDGSICVDFREKQKTLLPLSLSLSLLLPHAPHCPFLCQKWPFFPFWLFLFFSFPYFVFLFSCFIPPLDTWLNVSYSHKYTTCHIMCPSPKVSCPISPVVLKNVKFRLSQNPIKFDKVIRFRETNSTVKSVSSSTI